MSLGGFRKKRRPGNRNKTVAEAAHITLVKSKGCVCCIQLGFRPEDEDAWFVEAHHVLSAGLRIGHGCVLGLCPWHHRGVLYIEGLGHNGHRKLLGPSLAEGAGPFHEIFGEDAALLEQQAELLKGGCP